MLSVEHLTKIARHEKYLGRFKTNASINTPDESHESIWKLNASKTCTMKQYWSHNELTHTHICYMVIWNCASNNRISLHPTYDCTNRFGKRLYAIKCTHNYIWEKWREYRFGQERLNANRMQAKKNEWTNEWVVDDQTSITLTHKLSHTHTQHTYVYHARYRREPDLNENRDLSIFQATYRCSLFQVVCLRVTTMRKVNLKLASLVKNTAKQLIWAYYDQSHIIEKLVFSTFFGSYHDPSKFTNAIELELNWPITFLPKIQNVLSFVLGSDFFRVKLRRTLKEKSVLTHKHEWVC